MKLINETRKVLGHPYLPITATAVRVPVKNCHGESINIEFENSFTLEDIFSILKNAPGIIIKDDLDNLIYPTAEIANGHDRSFCWQNKKRLQYKKWLKFMGCCR